MAKQGKLHSATKKKQQKDASDLSETNEDSHVPGIMDEFRRNLRSHS